jgi:hypothetical protein
MLDGFVKTGGRIRLCPHCAMAAGGEADDLIDGARIATGDEVGKALPRGRARGRLLSLGTERLRPSVPRGPPAPRVHSPSENIGLGDRGCVPGGTRRKTTPPCHSIPRSCPPGGHRDLVRPHCGRARRTSPARVRVIRGRPQGERTEPQPRHRRWRWAGRVAHESRMKATRVGDLVRSGRRLLRNERGGWIR